MFDFEKLTVYQKARDFHQQVIGFIIDNKSIDLQNEERLQSSTFKLMTTLARSVSKITKAEKKEVYIEARGVLFECVVCIDLAAEEDSIPQDEVEKLYTSAQEISIILYRMIKAKETNEMVVST